MTKIAITTLVFSLFSWTTLAQGSMGDHGKMHKGEHKSEMHKGDHKSHMHKGKGHAHGHGEEGHKAELGQVSSGVQEIKVKGMVCEVCAYGIKKTLNKEDLVKKVDVNIKDHIVKIEYKDPAKVLSTAKLSEILKDAGYELDNGGN